MPQIITFAVLSLLVSSGSVFAAESCIPPENPVLGKMALAAIPLPLTSKNVPENWLTNGLLTCFFDGNEDQSTPETAFTTAFQSLICDQHDGYKDIFSWDNRYSGDLDAKKFRGRILAKYSRLKMASVTKLPNPDDKTLTDFCVDVVGTTKAGAEEKMMTVILRCTTSAESDCYMIETCQAGYRPPLHKTQGTGYDCPAEKF